MSMILTRFRLPDVSATGGGKLHCAHCGAVAVDADGETGLRLAVESHRDQHFARRALVALAGVLVGAAGTSVVGMAAESTVAHLAAFVIAAVAAAVIAHRHVPPVSPIPSTGAGGV